MINKLLKSVCALGFTLGLLAMPVKAAEVGIAIGVYGNLSTFDTSGSETEGNTANTNTETELHKATSSEDVDFGSFFAEADIRGEFAGLTLGVEYIPGSATLGSKSRTDTESPADRDSDNGTYTGSAEISDHVSVYVEPTIYLHEMFGLYFKGGASHITVNSLESLANGTTSSVYGNESVWGTSVGGGLKLQHSSGLFMKVEYLETVYDAVKFISNTGNRNTINAEPEQQSTRFALGFRF